MQIKISLLLFLFFTLGMCKSLFAQLSLPASESDTLTLLNIPAIENKTSFPELEALILETESRNTTFSIRKNHVYNQYGFFCKQEASRDKKTTIPVRIRLGCLQTVNQKEYGN